jgi:5-methylcytosine-specific restriction endonuclease McrA
VCYSLSEMAEYFVNGREVHKFRGHAIQPSPEEVSRRRGTPEQRESERRAYFAEKIAERAPAWQRPREINNLPPSELLRNRPEVIAAYRSMPYKEYLLTDWWKKVKRAAIIRAGYQCEECKERRPLDVHHLTYERLGTEADADLQALCRFCHDLAHIRTS